VGKHFLACSARILLQVSKSMQNKADPCGSQEGATAVQTQGSFMTEGASERRRPPARTLPEALVRSLRHELGDFLQKVYATVAILRTRLPADWEMEHGLITRLRARAEICKEVLDAAHDFVCPVILDYEPVDLGELARRLTTGAQQHYPQLLIRPEVNGPAVVTADPRRAAQVGEVLLANACAAAQAHVTFAVAARPEDGVVEWTIGDDGPGIAADLVERLFSPFFTTKAGHCGLGLALARKLVDLHGGQVSAGNQPEGGFKASAVFPVKPRPETTEE
jgi:signal transduction histidine kinase